MRATEIVVVRDDVPRARIEAIAAAHAWPCTGRTDRGHLVMASVQWTPQPGLKVTWVEDHTSDVRSVRVVGPPDDVRALAEQVREALPHELRSALVQAAHAPTAPAGLIRLAGKLAECRPATYDPAHLDALRHLLAHESLAVRRAAVRTAYHYPWPEVVEVVRQRYEDDVDVLAPQLEHLLSFLRGRSP